MYHNTVFKNIFVYPVFMENFAMDYTQTFNIFMRPYKFKVSLSILLANMC